MMLVRQLLRLEFSNREASKFRVMQCECVPKCGTHLRKLRATKSAIRSVYLYITSLLMNEIIDHLQIHGTLFCSIGVLWARRALTMIRYSE